MKKHKVGDLVEVRLWDKWRQCYFLKDAKIISITPAYKGWFWNHSTTYEVVMRVAEGDLIKEYKEEDLL